MSDTPSTSTPPDRQSLAQLRAALAEERRTRCQRVMAAVDALLEREGCVLLARPTLAQTATGWELRAVIEIVAKEDP